jgi:hypothetical protein
MDLCYQKLCPPQPANLSMNRPRSMVLYHLCGFDSSCRPGPVCCRAFELSGTSRFAVWPVKLDGLSRSCRSMPRAHQSAHGTTHNALSHVVPARFACKHDNPHGLKKCNSFQLRNWSRGRWMWDPVMTSVTQLSSSTSITQWPQNVKKREKKGNLYLKLGLGFFCDLHSHSLEF